MATVNWAILKDDKKKDGTWNVKIRITQKGKVKYMPTSHFVIKEQMTKAFKLKDQFILSKIDILLSEYRSKISSIPHGDLERMDASDLKDFLVGDRDSDISKIDFIEFGQKVISGLRAKGKNKSADNFRTVINSLKDYFRKDKVFTSDINLKFLYKFEEYLRGERVQVRVNQGELVTTTKTGLGDSGVYGYMRDLRSLFNKAREEFNDEETGHIRIAHYPFTKYKVGTPPAPVKRNMDIDDFRTVINLEVEKGSRAELARDLLKLSFYLCGMNAKDMYLQPAYKGGRINYNRAKTMGKRKDAAFISLHVPEEVGSLVGKYFGKLQKRYSSPDGLNRAIQKGCEAIAAMLPDIQEKLPKPLGFYFARHTFGNIARNTCRFSKDDVALAMNHVDNANRVTDAYIEKSWVIVDEVQAGVVGVLEGSAMR